MNPERWQKIRRICEDALEYDNGEREDFIVTACAGDAGLRKDVDSFLRRQRKARVWISLRHWGAWFPA